MKTMKKGFTLVELMVVIVIIGILAALAIPRFLGATNKTKAAEFKPVLKQLYTLQESYQQERDVYTNDADLLSFEQPNPTSARFSYSAIAGVSTTANDVLGTAVYIAGKGIKTPGGTELANTETACIDIDGDQAATTDLAALSNVAEEGTAPYPTCP